MNRGHGAGRKIVQVNDRLGIKGTAKQQGTTRSLYDALPISNTASGTTLRFFENANNRQFPFTNMNDNLLTKGENIALQRFSLLLLSTNQPATPSSPVVVQNVLPIDNIAAGTNALYRSDMNVFVAEDTVIKKQPIHSMYAPFNKDARFYGNIEVNPGAGPPLEAQLGIPHDVFWFDSDIILTENLRLVVEIKLPFFNLNLVTTSNFYLLLTLEGFGSIFSPKTTY